MDPFETQKTQSFNGAKALMERLGNYLLSILEKDGDKKLEFIRLLKLNLWGNKCDLSITNGVVSDEMEQLNELEDLNANILCDHSQDIWNVVSKIDKSEIIGKYGKSYLNLKLFTN